LMQPCDAWRSSETVIATGVSLWNGICNPCHSTYREQDPENRFKKGLVL